MAKSLVDVYEQTLRFVRNSLDATRGDWPRISRNTRIPYYTVQKIAQGTIERPSVESVQALADYFRRAA